MDAVEDATTFNVSVDTTFAVSLDDSFAADFVIVLAVSLVASFAADFETSFAADFETLPDVFSAIFFVASLLFLYKKASDLCNAALTLFLTTYSSALAAIFIFFLQLHPLYYQQKQSHYSPLL